MIENLWFAGTRDCQKLQKELLSLLAKGDIAHWENSIDALVNKSVFEALASYMKDMQILYLGNGVIEINYEVEYTDDIPKWAKRQVKLGKIIFDDIELWEDDWFDADIDLLEKIVAKLKKKRAKREANKGAPR